MHSELYLWRVFWEATGDVDCDVFHYCRRDSADYLLLRAPFDDWAIRHRHRDGYVCHFFFFSNRINQSTHLLVDGSKLTTDVSTRHRNLNRPDVPSRTVRSAQARSSGLLRSAVRRAGDCDR
ncbi:hypothetical protein VTN77DRAFT_2533 [Rasamsonia byssochlamydoides]|uniref:uncharacterized protein n=1 Tax=Rasamsonia byssochlamydoides TaxID=89139 RepID=UPI003742C590